jgi:hypothetical protein
MEANNNLNIKIIYAALVLLLVGQGVMFYKIFYPGGSTSSLESSHAAPGQQPTNSPDLSGIVVGGAGTVTNTISGTIAQLSTGSLQIKDETGTTDTVSVTADTVVQIGGKMKDMVTQQKELAAYNQQVNALMQDPVKNKEALAALRLPLAREFTPATFNDLAVGDLVTVTASSTATGAYVAVIITKNLSQ